VKFDPHHRIKEEPDDGQQHRHGDHRREPQRSRWEDDDDRPNRRVKREPDGNFQNQQRHRQQNDDRRRDARRQRDQDPGGSNFAQPSEEEKTAVEKEKPNFELSGKLTEDTNTFRGVVIKYNEPAEARKPKRRWRLYGFKGDESLPMLPIHRQSAYLLGRDRRIADIPVDHPSCSKQHAVLQYRLTDYIRPDGSNGRKVRPYIIDLGSANGTFVNNQRIEAQRYVELFEQDLLKFGFSTHEFVLLHENVDTSEIPQDSDTD
jgi:smad nuclear-interacting protein 1